MAEALLPEGRIEYSASCLHYSKCRSACQNWWQLSHQRCQLLLRPVLQGHCLRMPMADMPVSAATGALVGHAQLVKTLHLLQDVCVEGSWCIESMRVSYEEGCATKQ